MQEKARSKLEMHNSNKNSDSALPAQAKAAEEKQVDILKTSNKTKCTGDPPSGIEQAEIHEHASIRNPSRRLKCAAKFVGIDEHDEPNRLIGSPYFHTKGYTLEFSVDAGLTGPGRITLHIKLSKGSTSKTLKGIKQGDDRIHYFEAIFKIGAEINQGFQLEDIYCDKAEYISEGHPCWDKLLHKEVPESRALVKENLVALSFTSDGCEVPQDKSLDLVRFPSYVANALNFLLRPTAGSFRVTIYIPALPSFESAYKDWIGYLCIAAEQTKIQRQIADLQLKVQLIAEVGDAEREKIMATAAAEKARIDVRAANQIAMVDEQVAGDIFDIERQLRDLGLEQ